MMKLSQPNVFSALTKLGHKPETQTETNQIYIVVKHEKREFPIFFRILHEGDLLQILSFIPTNYQDTAISDLSRLLLMLNKELDVPGFCVDENSKTVFYRLVIPSYKKEIPDELLASFLNTVITVCTTFSPVVEAISVGAMTLEDVLHKANELKSKA